MTTFLLGVGSGASGSGFGGRTRKGRKGAAAVGALGPEREAHMPGGGLSLRPEEYAELVPGRGRVSDDRTPYRVT